jgi:predicted TIM-barrel fold metal-dependent hydrolase
VAVDFPELVIVCGHIGYPWTVDRLGLDEETTSLYLGGNAKRLLDI